MPKGSALPAMNAVVAQLRDELKAAGFRKKRLVFNRAEGDLVHVLQFYLGPAYSSVRGSFEVELGVWVPEVHQARYSDASSSGFATATVCAVSARLGHLVSDHEHWRSLTAHSAEDIAGQVRDQLTAAGLPWLDARRSRAELLHADDGADGFDPGALQEVERAIIEAVAGDRAAARATITNYLAGVTDNPGHVEYVSELMAGVGVDLRA